MRLLVTIALSAASALASNVFVLPPDAAPRTVNIATGDPLAAAGSFAAPPTPFLVLSNSSGTRYFVISRSSTDAVLIVNAQTNTVTTRFSLPQPALAAALTPDGSRLLVVADTLRVYDTNTEAQLASIDVGATPADVAVSQDSTFAYVMGRQFSAIDLIANTVARSITAIAGNGTGVAVSPSGLVFATAQNRIYEIDARGTAIVREHVVTGLPGKPLMTPDGRLAVALNLAPTPANALFTLNVNNNLVTPGPMPEGVVLDRLYNGGNSFVYGTTSSAPRELYRIEFGTFRLQLMGGATGVTAAAVSNEAEPRFLFYSSAQRLHRLDLIAGGQSTSIATGVDAAALAFAGPASLSPPTTLLKFNDNQTVTSGAASLPLIVRALDAGGKPVFGAAIIFSTTAAGASIIGDSASTNIDGYAAAVFMAPNFAGALTVTARSTTDPAASATFTINVTLAAPVDRMSILQGNGTVVKEQNLSGPLVVQVRNDDGTPAVGQLIAWAVQGTGFVNAATTVTDGDGRSSNNLNAPTTNPPQFARRSTVNASTPFASVNIAVITLARTIGPGPCSGQESPPPEITLLAPSPLELSGRAGQTLRGAVQVRLAIPHQTPTCPSGGIPNAGEPIPGVGITVSTGLNPANQPTAACALGAALTDSGGTATCDVVLGRVAGRAVLTIMIGNDPFPMPINLRIDPGPPSQLRMVQGNNQSGRPGETLPLALVALVTDDLGNPLPGTQVRWEVVRAGSVTLLNVVSRSDASGRVSVLPMLGSSAGPAQVRVLATGTNTLTFTVSVTVVVAQLLRVSGDTQSAIVGTSFAAPLVVQANDDAGRPLAGVPVSFRLASGSTTLSAASAITDSQGRASVTARAGNVAGTATVEASAGTRIIIFSLTVLDAAASGPAFALSDVTHGASFVRGAISPGLVVTIFGQRLGPNAIATLRLNAAGLVDTTLAGTRVFFDDVPAPMIYTLVTQVSVVAPYSLAGKTSTRVVVEYLGVRSAAVVVPVQAAAPALFTADSSGRGQGAILHSDYSANSIANPTARGTVILIFVSGEGQTNPAGVDGKLAAVPLPVPLLGVEVLIGGQRATIEYAGGAPGLVAGAMQINARIPQNIAAGNAVPIVVRIGDFSSPDGVTLAISP